MEVTRQWQKTIFEELGGRYERQGDYLIPCLTVPTEEEEHLIGIWGQRHLDYLKQYRKVTYTHLLTSGRLNAYLCGHRRKAGARNNEHNDTVNYQCSSSWRSDQRDDKILRICRYLPSTSHADTNVRKNRLASAGYCAGSHIFTKMKRNSRQSNCPSTKPTIEHHFDGAGIMHIALPKLFQYSLR